MLSYRHAFHAGNFADLLKHLVLIRSLEYLTRKQKRLLYLDTHAGAGGYSLTSAEAGKNLEYQTGIGRIWDREDLPEALEVYRDEKIILDETVGAAKSCCQVFEERVGKPIRDYVA